MLPPLTSEIGANSGQASSFHCVILARDDSLLFFFFLLPNIFNVRSSPLLATLVLTYPPHPHDIYLCCCGLAWDGRLSKRYLKTFPPKRIHPIQAMNQASRETGDMTPVFYDPYHPANNTMKEVVAPDHAEVNRSNLADLEPVSQAGVNGSADWGFSPSKSPNMAGAIQKPWKSEEMQSSAGKERKICGISLATFVLAIALVILLLAAAVGGGVGGSMAASTARE